MGATAVIGIGLPASGKTLALTELADQTGAVYICPDDMRHETDRRVSLSALWAEAYQRIHEALKAGRNVVVNATNAKVEDRRQLVQHIYGWAEEVIGVWFTASVDVCLSRGTSVPEHAMRRMAEDLDAYPPGDADGFDRVIQIAA